VKDNHPFLSTIADIIIIISIIYLLKQEDAHMINTRTRAGQERHRKLALTFCPSKKKKTNTLDIKKLLLQLLQLRLRIP